MLWCPCDLSGRVMGLTVGCLYACSSYAFVRKEQSYWEGGYRNRFFFVHYTVPSYFFCTHVSITNVGCKFFYLFIGVFVLSSSMWDRPLDCVVRPKINRRINWLPRGVFLLSVSAFVLSLLDGLILLKITVTVDSFLGTRATAAS